MLNDGAGVHSGANGGVTSVCGIESGCGVTENGGYGDEMRAERAPSAAKHRLRDNAGPYERYERFAAAVDGISRSLHRITAAEMEAYGLKAPYTVYLTAMSRQGEGVTAAQLAELCGRDKADVSRVTAAMEADGLVRKDGGSYRALLSLTGAGEAAAEHIRRKASAAVEIAGRGISEEERRVFYATLARIASGLQDICRGGIPNMPEKTDAGK